MVFLRKPRSQDRSAIEKLYLESKELHEPWVYAPKSYEYYLQEPGRYFICLEDSGKIVGSFHISGIIRGWFQSAYLSYNVFSPYQRRGYMREGLQLVLEEAFGPLNLHRLEANVQPDNSASLRLIEQAGFINEGYSKAYLNIGGLGWKDHERWAILNPHWREQE